MTIFGSFYTVDEGERAVVLEWGAAKEVTGPGLHWKVPFMESARSVSVRVKCKEWDGKNSLQAYSKDQQPAMLQMKICFKALSDQASVIMLYGEYKDVEGYADSVVTPKALEGLKTIFGQYNAVTAIQERAKFNADLDELIRSITGPVLIESVQVQDIAFSDAYEQSVEDRMKAQVEVEKVQQNLEREKLQADIKVVQAQAEAERVRLAGEAEAAAIEARGQALRDNPDLVALVAAEKWDGKLPTTQVPGAAVPFMQIPTGQ